MGNNTKSKAQPQRRAKFRSAESNLIQTPFLQANNEAVLVRDEYGALVRHGPVGEQECTSFKELEEGRGAGEMAQG